VREVVVESPSNRGERPSAPLAEYRRGKLDLADVIRASMDLARACDDDAGVDTARDLLARLAEDRFNLVVVGQFSRGKSTLMNAILGHPYLPTGAVPMTSVITTVRYGNRPRALVRRTGSSLPLETSLPELVRFVSAASDEREQRPVDSVDVEVPEELLRLGFAFVDTPGVGSAIVANTETTKRFLPEADAVIFVTSFDSLLTEAEVEFLTEVRQLVGKLFFVVNKLDLVSEAERDVAIGFVQERLSSRLALGDQRLFMVSARDALEAKSRRDANALAATGLPDLERVLTTFLTEEKSREFLLRVAERTRNAIARQQKLAVERPGHAEDGEIDDVAALEGLAARVSGLTAEIAGWNLSGGATAELPVVPSAVSDGSADGAAGCTVCRRLEGELFKFMSRRQFDLATRENHRTEHAEIGGFCPLHTWLYADVGSDVGISVGYAGLAAETAMALRTIEREASTAEDLRWRVTRLTGRSELCPACHAIAVAETEIVDEMVANLSADDSQTPNPSLCLLHLAAMLTQRPELDPARRLVRALADTLMRASEDMRTYALKRHALHRELVTADESDAYLRTLSYLAGRAALAGPPRRH
jgi:small GTP-binding protein